NSHFIDFPTRRSSDLKRANVRDYVDGSPAGLLSHRKRPLPPLFGGSQSLREFGELRLVLGALGLRRLFEGALRLLHRFPGDLFLDRKSTRLNSSHVKI